MKKPWLSAFLNLIFLGSGYVYNGKRIAVGVILIISEILTFSSSLSESLVTQLLSYPMIILSALLMQIALAIDSYQEAKQINQEKK